MARLLERVADNLMIGATPLVLGALIAASALGCSPGNSSPPVRSSEPITPSSPPSSSSPTTISNATPAPPETTSQPPSPNPTLTYTPTVSYTTPPSTQVLSLTDKNAILSNAVTYQVTRTVRVKNETATVQSLRIWMAAPATWDSQTNVSSETSDPSCTSSWQDAERGNRGLFWQFNNDPAAGSSITITDQFTYTCFQVSYQVDPSKIGQYDKGSPDYQMYTRSEKYIEADDAQIQALAAQLQQGKTNPYDTAASFYDWVTNNMNYQLVGGLKGATFALKNPYGECGDYSALFVALCRTAGIPARPVVGRWATSNSADWHVWAEFYVPSYGWIPVDPADAALNHKGRASFGSLDNKRLILHKGFNISLQPNPGYIDSQPGILQTLSWEWRGTGGQLQTDISYTIGPLPSK